VSVLVLGPDDGLARALRANGHDASPTGDPEEADALVTVAPSAALRPLLELEPGEWLAAFRSGTEEPFFVAQRYLRGAYARARGGCWVAVTSVLGVQPVRGGGSAGAAARALQTLVRVAAIEGAPQGVRANAVAVGRHLSAGDTAGAVGWLLSDKAALVTGTVVRVDGV
jgi:NAD(P)-dependent dehydrogenase (short-subunit alcohol dehydrogenase family)